MRRSTDSLGRRYLTPEEKGRIEKLYDTGTPIMTIGDVLGRSHQTVRNYINHGRYPMKGGQRNFRHNTGRSLATMVEGKDATCPTCERKLFFNTDGNGHLLEYCITCVA